MDRAQEKVLKRATRLHSAVRAILRIESVPWCVKCRFPMRGNGRGFWCSTSGCFASNAEAPWCLPCRIEMAPYGYDRKGSPRWICTNCTRTVGTNYLGYFDPNSLKRPVRTTKFDDAISLFKQGVSVRSVAQRLGIHHKTAMRYRDIGIKEEVRCSCGQPARHQGWCRWRYQQSPNRQAFMKQWRKVTAQ